MTLFQPRRAPRIVASLGLVGLSLVAGGCGPDVASRSRPPIILISIDTLRSDRLPMYGYQGVETPAIDRLRQDAVLFARAYSPVPLTLPAHASLFTGLLPGDHGVRDNVGYRVPDVDTLASILATAGYRTGGAISSVVLRRETGVARGFAHWDETISADGDLASQQRAGEDTVAAVMPWLRRVADQPFFLFLHLYEPHSPYSPPEPFASQYPSGYDGEVAAADRVVGLALDELRRLGLYDRAIVVLLSDHGEGLGDHGEEEHGVLMYRESLQVPLLIKLPAGLRARTTIDQPVQLTDVLPTVLDLLELPVPERLGGRSVFELEGQSPRGIYGESFYARLHFGWSEQTSLVEGSLHFLGGPEPELYDLVADPGETRDLLGERRSDSRRMAAALERFTVPLVAPGEVDPETRQRLAALGYLTSSSSSSSSGRSRSMVDPKSKIAVLAETDRAIELVARGDTETAIPMLERLLAAHPEMVDAWEHLAQALADRGRFEAALEAQRQAIRYSGGAAHHALAAGDLSLKLGRYSDAEAHAQLAAALYPGPAAHLLARVALAKGDLVTAEEQARRAFELRAQRRSHASTLVEVLLERGRIDQALQALDECEQEFVDASDAVWWRLEATALRAAGRTEEATAALERGLTVASSRVARKPEESQAHTDLVRILLLLGRDREALEAIERARSLGAASAVLLQLLAKSLVESGRSAAGIEILRELAARGEPGATSDLAVALSAIGQHAEAESVLGGAIASGSIDPAIHEGLATLRLRQRRFVEAGKLLERALELDRRRPVAWNLLAVARWQGSADGDGAIEAWGQALALDPRSFDALFNLGTAAAELGRQELARSSLERFVAEAAGPRYDSDRARARALLARLE